MPRSAAAVGAALIASVLVLSGCTSDEQDAQSAAAPDPTRSFTADVPVLVPGAPGEAADVVEPGQDRTVPNAALFGDADVAFVRDMVVHHTQALRMAELTPERAEDERVRRLAARIAAAQEPEIAAMQAWLEERDLPVPDTGSHGHEQHQDRDRDHMPGMASPEDMSRLAAARGAEHDRLFLELMTRHHEGALQMAGEAGSAVQHPQIADMVADTGLTQSVEIRRMQELLGDLQVAAAAGRSPAA